MNWHLAIRGTDQQVIIEMVLPIDAAGGVLCQVSFVLVQGAHWPLAHVAEVSRPPGQNQLLINYLGQ